MHPDAPHGCGAVVSAHSIQRSGILDRIARDGHVYALDATVGGPPDHEFRVREELVGIKEASTFNGFCAPHDDALFAVIEKQGFRMDEEAALLLGFRSLCYGYYQTIAGLRAIEYFRLLRAAPDMEAEWQSFLAERKAALRLSIGIAETQMREMGHRIRQRDFRDVRYYALEFSGPITIAAAFGWHPTHDFEERLLHGPGSEPTSDLLLWSALPTGRGGVCLYVWLRQQPTSLEFIRSLHRVPDPKAAHAMVRFSSLCANTYFAPAWWDSLPEFTREWIRKRLHAAVSPGRIKPNLRPDSLSLADWGIARRLTNLSPAELGDTRT